MAVPPLLAAGAGAASSNLLGPVSYGAGCLAWKALPIKFPNAEDALRLAGIGQATNLEVSNCFKIEGYDFDYARVFTNRTKLDGNGLLSPDLTVYARFSKLNERIGLVNSPIPTPDEVIALFTRKLINIDLARHWLMIHYRGDRALVDTLLKTQYQIPGPSDLVRFAVREAFDVATIQQYGYHKEFPKEILTWMERQGYGQDIGMPRPIGATDNVGNAMGGNATWSDLYWYSHWELPSLSQGYEMLHRLYPNSRYGVSPNVTGGNTFDEANLASLQKAQDIPEYWRDRLQAISYNPPTRVDTKRMYFDDVIDKAAVYHSLRASGYNDADANNMTNWMELRKNDVKNKDVKKTAADYVCTHLSLGTIDRAKAEDILDRSGYNGVDKQRFIEKCFLGIQSESLKVALKTIRILYLKGQLNDGELAEQLRNIRVSELMIEQYVFRWRYERDNRYKQASLGVLIKAFKNQTLPETSLRTALVNFGYQESEQYHIINNAKIDMVNASIKTAKAQYRQLVARNKEMARIVQGERKAAIQAAKATMKSQESKAAKQLRGLVSAASEKNIDTWYASGVISIRDIALRYLLKYWSIPDIERRLNQLDPDLTMEFISGEIKKAEKVFVSLGFAKPIQPTGDGMLPIGQKPYNLSGKGQPNGKDSGG